MSDAQQQIAEAARPGPAIDTDVDTGFRREERLRIRPRATGIIPSHGHRADNAKLPGPPTPCPR